VTMFFGQLALMQPAPATEHHTLTCHASNLQLLPGSLQSAPPPPSSAAGIPGQAEKQELVM